MTGTAEEIGAREHALLGAVLDLPDAMEGPTAFVRKREPVWTSSVESDLLEWPD